MQKLLAGFIFSCLFITYNSGVMAQNPGAQPVPMPAGVVAAPGQPIPMAAPQAQPQPWPPAPPAGNVPAARPIVVQPQPLQPTAQPVVLRETPTPLADPVEEKPAPKVVKKTVKKKKVAKKPVDKVDYADLKKTLKGFFPNENIGIQKVNRGIAVSGVVTDAEISHRVMELVDQYFNPSGSKGETEVVNMMQIRTSQQVMLRVRVGEIKRSVLKNYALAGFASLEKDGLVRILAEPNLVAISGETANFLAGGQIPIPVQGDHGTVVNYKNYGVGLEFTPMVLSQNRIRLTVDSEVSQLSKEGAITTGNFSIPGISSRRAKTTVELAPGESFMIAGLIKDNINIDSNGATPLSNIPIIGSVLRSSGIERDETELVISVTPYLVDPVKAGDVKLPTDNFRAPNTLENIFFGALGSMSGKSNVQSQLPGGDPGLEGTFGYMVE